MADDEDERLIERRVPETWIPVDSSWVAAVRYNHSRRSFDIRVKEGSKVYTAGPNFLDCSPAEFIDMLSSGSVGGWLWSHYPFHFASRRGKKKRK